MKYTVEIRVKPEIGRDITIKKSLEIRYDDDRGLYVAGPAGCYTYGETAEGLAIRLATHEWQMPRA